MSILVLLIPITVGLGLVALLSFLWSLRAHQYDDLRGAAERVLLDDEAPLPRAARTAAPKETTR